MLKTDKLTEEEKETLEKYTSLIHLTMNDVGLTSLENFPELQNLNIVRKNNFYIFYHYFFSLNSITIN